MNPRMWTKRELSDALCTEMKEIWKEMGTTEAFERFSTFATIGPDFIQ